MSQLIIDTLQNNSIKLNIQGNDIFIEQNEFLYFNYLLEKVENFFNDKDNKNKNVLLKIPGTGKFEKLNHLDFINIQNQVKSKIERYEKEYNSIF